MFWSLFFFLYSVNSVGPWLITAVGNVHVSTWSVLHVGCVTWAHECIPLFRLCANTQTPCPELRGIKAVVLWRSIVDETMKMACRRSLTDTVARKPANGLSQGPRVGTQDGESFFYPSIAGSRLLTAIVAVETSDRVSPTADRLPVVSRTAATPEATSSWRGSPGVCEFMMWFWCAVKDQSVALPLNARLRK